MTALCVVAGFASLCNAEVREPLAECPVDMVNNWWPGLLIPRATVTSAEPGSKIEMAYEVLPGVTNAKFSLCTNYIKTSLPGFEGTEQDANEPGRMNLPLEGVGVYSYTITEETIAQLSDSDFHGWDDNVRLRGQGFTITSLDLVSPDPQDESLADCPVVMANNWWPGLLIPRATVTSAQPGWRIVMDYQVNEGVDNARFSLCTNYGKTPLPGFEGTEPDPSEPTRMNMSLEGTGVYSYTITEETISQLGTSDFHGWDGNVRIVGQGFTITKLVLMKSESGTDVENIFNSTDENLPVEYYNLQGVRVTEPINGNYIRRQGNKVYKIIVRCATHFTGHFHTLRNQQKQTG